MAAKDRELAELREIMQKYLAASAPTPATTPKDISSAKACGGEDEKEEEEEEQPPDVPPDKPRTVAVQDT